jgi:hypothetical protein
MFLMQQMGKLKYQMKQIEWQIFYYWKLLSRPQFKVVHVCVVFYILFFKIKSSQCYFHQILICIC